MMPGQIGEFLDIPGWELEALNGKVDGVERRSDERLV
jgi:hypothetical protein